MDAQRNKVASESHINEERELELYVLRSDYQRAVNQVDRMQIEINRLRGELDRRPRDPIDAETLRKDSELISAKIKEVEERRASNMEALQAERNARFAERSALHSQVEHLQKSLQAAEERADLEGSERDPLSRELSQQKAALADCDSLRSERDFLRTECERLEAELSQARIEFNHYRQSDASQLREWRQRASENELARRAAEQTIDHLRATQMDVLAKFAKSQQDRKIIDYIGQLASSLIAQRQLVDQNEQDVPTKAN